MNGHSESTGNMQLAWQYKHPTCQDWVWVDANYCPTCGRKITSDIREKAMKEIENE